MQHSPSEWQQQTSAGGMLYAREHMLFTGTTKQKKTKKLVARIINTHRAVQSVYSLLYQNVHA